MLTQSGSLMGRKQRRIFVAGLVLGLASCHFTHAVDSGSCIRTVVCERGAKGKFDHPGRRDFTTEIKCAGGTLTIVAASYGRQTCADKVCYSHGPNNCVAPGCARGACSCGDLNNALSFLKRTCEGKTHCRVRASNAMIGDPCAGEHKYLSIDYTCDGSTSCETSNSSSHLGGGGERVMTPQMRSVLLFVTLFPFVASVLISVCLVFNYVCKLSE